MCYQTTHSAVFTHLERPSEEGGLTIPTRWACSPPCTPVADTLGGLFGAAVRVSTGEWQLPLTQGR